MIATVTGTPPKRRVVGLICSFCGRCWQVIRDRLQGYAYSLVVAYCTGLYAGASITLDVNESFTFATRPGPALSAGNVSLAVFRCHKGDCLLARTLDFRPTSRPYFILQQQLFEKGANQQHTSSDAWTGVFNYTIPYKPAQTECGFAKSLPVPNCMEGLGGSGPCGGFCGAIASHVSLDTIKLALQESNELRLCMINYCISKVLVRHFFNLWQSGIACIHQIFPVLSSYLMLLEA